jgi:hypothetical protein
MANPKTAAWYGNDQTRVMGPGAGNVYYVNGYTGADTNDGLSPATAKLTITAGIGLCTDAPGQNDYVFVLRYPSAGAAGEVWPIAVDVESVHIIGAGLYGASTCCWVAPTGNTAAFEISKNGVEIAGFDLAGGAAHGCIENSGSVWRAHIHHNDFALQRTTQDGIRMTGAVDCPHWLIEDNTFGEYFDNISRDGIRIEHNSTRSLIRRNLFRVDTGSSQVGIHLQGLCTGNIAILDNTFMVPDAIAGEAITTSATAQGLATGNVACNGKAAMGNIPWVDGGAFSWGWNVVTAAPSACIMPA